MQIPLILVVNDDGITSPGLWAATKALMPLGDVLVVAPNRQWSGAGRAMPHDVTGKLQHVGQRIDGIEVAAYAVDGSPAQCVQHGVLELSPRMPSLVVSGINSGANLSIEVTISGTVGAALEAGAFGIPALAVSLEMDQAHYLSDNHEADYTAAQAYIRQFAQQVLAYGLPHGVDALNINIPADAAPSTPWRRTRLSRHRYFDPLPPDRASGKGRPRYKHIEHPEHTEIDSDIRAIVVDRMVSITPLSLDMTAPADTYVYKDVLPFMPHTAEAVSAYLL